jgi:hypothetical protein
METDCSEKPQTKIYQNQKMLDFGLWDFPRIEQVIGRAIRYDSHANLPVIQLKTEPHTDTGKDTNDKEIK